jgi:hypothetical protein
VTFALQIKYPHLSVVHLFKERFAWKRGAHSTHLISPVKSFFEIFTAFRKTLNRLENRANPASAPLPRSAANPFCVSSEEAEL